MSTSHPHPHPHRGAPQTGAARGENQPTRSGSERDLEPGEDPGSLSDEEYVFDGGPDAVDAAQPDDSEPAEAAPKAPPDAKQGPR